MPESAGLRPATLAAWGLSGRCLAPSPSPQPPSCSGASKAACMSHPGSLVLGESRPKEARTRGLRAGTLTVLVALGFLFKFSHSLSFSPPSLRFAKWKICKKERSGKAELRTRIPESPEGRRKGQRREEGARLDSWALLFYSICSLRFFFGGPFLWSLLKLLHCCFCFRFCLLVVRHVESLLPDQGTYTPCIGRRSLNHWTTREAPLVSAHFPGEV